MRHLFGEHGIFAVGAYHASHSNDPHGHTPITGYLLAFPLAFVPLAILLDWFAVNVAWPSDFAVLRVLFTIPGLVCTLLALIGLVAWLFALVYAAVYVGGYIAEFYRGHRRAK